MKKFFNKTLYASMHDLDFKYLKHRRRKLEKQLKKIRVTRRKIARLAKDLEEKEAEFQSGAHDYKSLVNSVTRKLQLHDTEVISKRQEQLQQARISRAIENPEPEIDFPTL